MNLTSSLFGVGRGIKLRVPFGEELQEKAESLFRGAFSYYRNYAAHDGSKIDKDAAARIMIVASELMELIGASLLSYKDIGGMKGLIKSGIFKREESVRNLLKLLNGYTIQDDVVDGFFEDLYEKGFIDEQMHSVIDLGLVEYITKKYFPTTEEVKHSHFISEEVSWFDLTNLGKKLIDGKK